MATTRTIAGTLKDPEGTNMTGTITFRYDQPLLDSSGNIVVTTAPIIATLSAGAFSVTLYATDDDGTSPSNATCTVIEDLAGGDGNARQRRFQIEIPAGDGTLRYEDISPTTRGPAVTSYATLSALTAHIGDSSAHDSSDIDYTGAVTGASTVEDALDTLESDKATAAYVDDQDVAYAAALIAQYQAADALIDLIDVVEPASYLRLVDDLVSGGASSMPSAWTTTLSGTAAALTDAAAANLLPGVKRLDTGTDTNGLVICGMDSAGVDAASLGSAWFRVKISTIGSGTNGFVAYVGMMDGIAASGAWFTGGPGATNWQAVTHNGSTSTTTDTGVAIDAGGGAGAWVWLKLERTASSVIFSIDGTVVATVTTTLKVSGLFRPVVAISKTSGTSERYLVVDAVAVDWAMSRGTMG